VPNRSNDIEVLSGAYRKALANEAVYKDLLFYIHNSGFTPDPYEAAFKAGERDLALRLLSLAGKID